MLEKEPESFDMVRRRRIKQVIWWSNREMHSHLELVDRFLLLLLGRRAANVVEEEDVAVADIVADAAAGGLLLHSIPNKLVYKYKVICEH